MKRNFKKLALFCLLAIAAVGCMNPNKVKVLGVEGVEMKSLSRVEVALDVENMSNCNVLLKGGTLDLLQKGAKIGEVKLADDVKVAKRTAGRVVLPLQVKITASNPLLLLNLARQGSKIDASAFSVSGVVHMKAGAASKKFNLDNVPLSKILTIFGFEGGEY